MTPILLLSNQKKVKMRNLVVVSSTDQVNLLKSASNSQVITAHEYLTSNLDDDPKVRVFNLCNDYSYCKKGYYVSLLAEARGHRPLPSVSTISDFQNKDSIRVLSTSLSNSLNKILEGIKSDHFELSVYFGKNTAEKYNSLARQIFNHFQAPLVRAYFSKKNSEWQIKSISPISFKDVPKTHQEFLAESMNAFFSSGQNLSKKRSGSYRYDLAILCNDKEELPPSNAGAIKAFIKAAKDLRIYAEVIGPKDISLLSRFDALFIRETTSVFDHTYKFAKRAELEELVVIDDPTSILRCCNKVYLHDYLVKKHLATPKTSIIQKDSDLTQFTNYPLVIKKPDSAFSAGVKKVTSLEELKSQANEYFKQSDLLIVQEFLQTDYDWRIGVIDNEPLYACRYHMAKNHWQIISRENGRTQEGSVDTLALDEAPKKAIQLALKACKSIGNSLYGVDIKEKDGEFYIIEINDNPSIEKGWEDRVLGPQLYTKIMSVFLRRLEAR